MTGWVTVVGGFLLLGVMLAGLFLTAAGIVWVIYLGVMGLFNWMNGDIR